MRTENLMEFMGRVRPIFLERLGYVIAPTLVQTCRGPLIPPSSYVKLEEGLYFLIDGEGTCSYIGKTMSPESRLRPTQKTGSFSSHERLRELTKGRIGWILIFMAVPDEISRHILEQLTIKAFPESDNIAHNRRRAEEERARKIDTILKRVEKEPGIGRWRLIEGMAAPTGRHLINELVNAGKLVSVDDISNKNNRPMTRHFLPGQIRLNGARPARRQTARV